MVLAVLAATLLGSTALPRVVPQHKTAEVRLVVGDQALKAQAVPGYAVATSQLAETYARFVGGDAMQSAVGPQATVAATAIPESSVIRVEATARSDAEAMRAAQAASTALTKAVAATGGADALQRKHAALLRARAALRQVSRQLTMASPAAKDQASDEVYVADARVRALAQAYQEQLLADLQGPIGVTVVQSATLTTSERPKLMLLGGLTGGVALIVLFMLASMARHFLRPA